MYGYIKGTIKDIESNYVIIDNHDIGYIIYVPNPYYYKLDEIYTIYTYTQVREDEYSLYGFANKEQLNLFLKLIQVKGVGPKMALPMLATGSPEGIYDAIERENILYLKKFPKIGEKVARQIILDLKGKLNIQIAEINFRIQKLANQEEEEPRRVIGFELPNNDEEYEDDEDEDI